MCRTGIVSLTLAASLLPLGCGTQNPSTDSKTQNANEKVKEAVDATHEAAKAKRDQYAAEMHKKLNELDAKYEDLKARASKAEKEDKKKLEEKLEVARVKRDAAGKKLTEMKEASLDRWEKVKDGVGNAFDDLRKVFD